MISGHFTNPEEIIKKQEFVFNPHVTIAYRDLQHTMFIEAWEEYREKKYAAGFRVSSFQLLQHDGNMWNVISNFSLPLSVQ